MNWYKQSDNSLTLIRSIAEELYQEEVVGYDDEVLSSLCLTISEKLKQKLIGNGFPAILVRGSFGIDDPDLSYYEDWDSDDFNDEAEYDNAMYNPLHYWVDVDGVIVDITASQFNDEIEDSVDHMPAIVVGLYSDFPRYNKIGQR